MNRGKQLSAGLFGGIITIACIVHGLWVAGVVAFLTTLLGVIELGGD